MVIFDELLPYMVGAERAGVSTERLLDSSFISSASAKPGAPISNAHVLLFYLSLMEGCDDESWGLSEERIPLGLSAIVIRAVLGSADFEQALASFQQVYNTMTPIRIATTAFGNQCRVEVKCNFPDSAESCMFEDGFIGWMWSVFSRYVDCPLPLLSISTRNPYNPGVGKLHWATGDKLRLAANASIGFARSWLAAPSRVKPTKDSAYQCFARSIQPVPSTPPYSVLSRGSLQSLSKEAGISKSTMSRRLSADGVGFRAERESALIGHGLAMLRQTRLSVDAIAAELGYSDARSFRRLLKSNLGVTPREVRDSGWCEPVTTAEHRRLNERLRQLSARYEL